VAHVNVIFNTVVAFVFDMSMHDIVERLSADELCELDEVEECLTSFSGSAKVSGHWPMLRRHPLN
jgi:hypothetical protein